MTNTTKKQAFITGTLLLTATGFLTRILGFFYRIFLSRTIGAEGLGLYNMVHPIYGICFALCAGSIQTAISRFVAANTEKGKSIFRTALLISFSLSVILALFIYQYADFLAIHILMEERCGPLLPFIALSIPCSAIHACINGYYYGMQKTKIPAFAQIVEQVIRMTAVFLVAGAALESGIELTVRLAVFGHLIGEIASGLYSVLAYQFFSPKHQQKNSVTDFYSIALPLMALALPLMGNRLVLNILASAEAIWIPSRLELFGLSNSGAFSVYGVLTGMALPFILFPSAITNSMAVLLLPTVAEAQAEGNHRKIGLTISMSLRYSLYMGILCIGIFTLFGHELGVSVFHDANAGSYIKTLAWLCPFLYLATTMGSILNGLGKASTTFLQNVAALLLRLAFVVFGIPRIGIIAYLWGMLSSELLLALLHLHALKKLIPFSWNAWDMILKPTLLLLLSIGIYYAFFAMCPLTIPISAFIETGMRIGFICFCYGGLLGVFHLCRR